MIVNGHGGNIILMGSQGDSTNYPHLLKGSREWNPYSYYVGDEDVVFCFNDVLADDGTINPVPQYICYYQATTTVDNAGLVGPTGATTPLWPPADTDNWSLVDTDLGYDFIHVGQWQLVPQYRLAEVTNSGSNGAEDLEHVLTTYTFSLELPWDDLTTPELWLHSGLLPVPGSAEAVPERWVSSPVDEPVPVSLLLNLGKSRTRFGTVEGPLSYFTPRAFIEQFELICDSKGDVIRLNVSGRGSSRVFGPRMFYVGEKPAE